MKPLLVRAEILSNSAPHSSPSKVNRQKSIVKYRTPLLGFNRDFRSCWIICSWLTLVRFRTLRQQRFFPFNGDWWHLPDAFIVDIYIAIQLSAVRIVVQITW